MQPRIPSRLASQPLTNLTLRPITSAPSLAHPLHRQQTRTIRSIQQSINKGNAKTAHISSRFNNHPSLPTLIASTTSAQIRKAPRIPLRTGALATKKGMTALYDSETGKRTPCTVLQMDRVQVVGHKTRERHGYFAVCVGSGWRHPRNVGSAMLGVWSKTMYKDAQGGEVGLPPKRDVSEFRVRDASALVPVGRTIEADWFKVGQFVDAKSENKGKGFAGGMKRWGFGGQPASHGVSLTHRSMGSAGGSQGSGSRVHPGKKMAGNMGGYNHTVQNLKVMLVDETNGLVVVSGAVSGPNGCIVKLQDAIKKPWPDVDPIPAPREAPPPPADAAAESASANASA